jgi:hypothetical protein
MSRAAPRLLLAIVAATTLASSADGAVRLADIPFGVAMNGLFDEARNDGRQGEPGSWELLGGRLGAEAVELTVRIQPPGVGLPVQAGPAVLFGGLFLSGDAGGDMATGQWVDSFVAETLAPCPGDPCRFAARISLPVHDLAAAIKRLATHGRLLSVSAELTLVRSFGGGTWSQVLPFAFGGAGALEADAGRLGSIGSATGPLFPYGLFPSGQATRLAAEPDLIPAGFDYGADVERRRRDAGDASKPLPTTHGQLHVRINPPCEGSWVLSMHDEAGDRIFDAPLDGTRVIDEQLPLPTGVSWWLTLHDGGGIDFDQGRRGSGVRIGPVGTTETPIAVDAAFDCAVPRGEVRVTDAAQEASDAPAATPAERRSDGASASDYTFPAFILVVASAALVLLVALRSIARNGRSG